MATVRETVYQLLRQHKATIEQKKQAVRCLRMEIRNKKDKSLDLT